jgi:hypothetical protein
MQDHHRITYHQRNFGKKALTVGIQVIDLAWQVYGNFIYYEWRGINDENDKDFRNCMVQKNNGITFCMFLLIMVGYSFMLVYGCMGMAMLCFFTRRFNEQKSKVNESKIILKTLKRQKYKDGEFGDGITPDNECIICMASYDANDTVTSLGCNKTHFYHTPCIEEWIKKGNN